MSFLFMHYLFARKYWEVSNNLAEKLQYETDKLVTERKKWVHYTLLILFGIIPIEVSIFKYYTTIDKINNTTHNKSITVTYLISL
jgi:hypothetical protein